MRTVLVTGSSGLLGQACRCALEAAGWSVTPFDLSDGQDLRDEDQVMTAAAGASVIVHCAAIPRNNAGTPAAIMATNVLGTWHILSAAEAHGVERVVHISSVQVFGFSDGEGEPDYLPVDDLHPRRSALPYGLSKRLAEDMCEAWTSRTGIPTVVLRPVWILPEETFGILRGEFGSAVHIDDVCDAVLRSATVPLTGHHRLLVCGPGPFDTSEARRVLGWTPRHRGSRRAVVRRRIMAALRR